MDKQKIEKAIDETGFPLEFEINSILKQHNWQTINNRYYIDDVKEIEREIDILAYKCRIDRDNKIAFYTTLIISCKKSVSSLWAFLSTDKPKYDPNFKYFVVSNKTSDERLEKMLSLSHDELEQAFSAKKSLDNLFDLKRKIFGFQQVNLKSYRCEDDKRIYDSIITTIKALEYETNCIQNKNLTPDIDTTFYNFNLISVFDGEMVEVSFKDGQKTVSEIDNAIYINRHIINRKENFYKVHFIKSIGFENYLGIYDDLSVLNYEIYDSLIDSFYENIFESKDKVMVYWRHFCNDMISSFNNILKYNLKFESDHSTKKFDYSYGNDLLTIYYDGYSNIFNGDDKINQEEHLKKRTKKYLLKYFRYDGDFIYEADLPF